MPVGVQSEIDASTAIHRPACPEGTACCGSRQLFSRLAAVAEHSLYAAPSLRRQVLRAGVLMLIGFEV